MSGTVKNFDLPLTLAWSSSARTIDVEVAGTYANMNAIKCREYSRYATGGVYDTTSEKSSSGGGGFKFSWDGELSIIGNGGHAYVAYVATIPSSSSQATYSTPSAQQSHAG